MPRNADKTVVGVNCKIRFRLYKCFYVGSMSYDSNHSTRCRYSVSDVVMGFCNWTCWMEKSSSVTSDFGQQCNC